MNNMHYLYILYRLWDARSCKTEKEITLPGAVLSIELSRDRTLLTISHSNGVTFLDAKT